MLQEERDVLPDVLRLGARVVPHEGLATLSDEELLPVPADVVGLEGRVGQGGRVGEGQARGGTVRLRSKQARHISSSCYSPLTNTLINTLTQPRQSGPFYTHG